MALRWRFRAPHKNLFVEKSKLILRIRDVIKSNPSPTIICFHHGLLPDFWAASLFLKRRLISSERNSLELYKHIKKRKWNLSFLLLNFAANIIQFQEYKKLYPKHLRKKSYTFPIKWRCQQPSQTHFIPNDKGRFVVLCVGRLCKQKRQTLLLNAFEMVAKGAGLGFTLRRRRRVGKTAQKRNRKRDSQNAYQSQKM